MQPDFEQLLQILRAASQSSPYKEIRVVLVSSDGEPQFIEAFENPQLRQELQAAYGKGFLALGLLGWEFRKESFQAKSILFPWHEEDTNLRRIFKRACEAGVDSVRDVYDRWPEV